MHIYIVRHTAYANPTKVFAFHLPLNLSLEGRADAFKIGNWFKKNSANKIPIYSSPIVRCVQTSEIIASKTKSFVSIDKRLIEASCPKIQGKIDYLNTSGEDEPSKESRESMLKRILDIFEEKAKFKEDCILISHGDPITLLYHHLKKIKVPKYFWKKNRSKNIVEKGDIVDIEIEDGII